MTGLRSPREDSRRGERGVALVIVLGAVVLLSLQLGLLTMQVSDSARQIENAVASARARALVHAGIEVAVAEVATAAEGTLGQSRTFRIDGSDVSVSLHDEAGRVNLNLAPLPLLTGLLKAVGASAEDAIMLADRIADWRDPDHQRRDKGAEDKDYRRGRLEHGAADRPFVDAADLVRVLGMPREIAERLAEQVTVHSGGARINPLAATEVVLRALPGVPRQSLDHALELLRRRGARAGDEVATLLEPAQEHLTRSQGPVYRVRVDVRGGVQRVTGSGEAIVALGLDAATPYRMLAWRQRRGNGA